MYHCCAFHHYHERPPRSIRLPIIAASRDSIQSNKPTLDPDIAAQFTIQVCTSTSCTRKLNKVGLDRFHVLGEIYAQAQSANLEKRMTIEDGGCQGGRNCKMGPCVAILHEDFEGNVALEGMNSNEFLERVFHNVLTNDDAGRVWGCIENAISLMAEEFNTNGDD
ncbi:hypothetical protein ACHAW5_006950 [Stephanodiscus triporus]|uniref:Uncharacterized protein n=1 Tax=Stephanodiscus triporus TaxID=2934178 RepID=A0ABD3MSN1_9STRA